MGHTRDGGGAGSGGTRRPLRTAEGSLVVSGKLGVGALGALPVAQMLGSKHMLMGVRVCQRTGQGQRSATGALARGRDTQTGQLDRSSTE